MQKYIDYKTYKKIQLKDIPKEAIVLRSHVVFTLKKMKTGQRQFKARCVIDGSKDSRNLYSSTSNADQSEARTIIHMASTLHQYSGDIRTADVENGYFHADTDGLICIIPPKIHKDHGTYAWLLQKNVYGIPNAGRLFEQFVETSLTKTGWQRIQGLKHSWIKTTNGKIQGYLCAYVDDFLVIGINQTSLHLLTELKRHMNLNIDNAEKLTFTGTTINKINNEIEIHQEEYIKSLSNEQSKQQFEYPLPIRINEKQDTSPHLNTNMATEYRTKLGQLLFISRDSRPDLAYAASFLGQFSKRPTERSYRLLQRAISYAVTHPFIMHYPSQHESPKLSIECYVDASLGNKNDIHAQTGFIILINKRPFYWKSKRQQRVARSSTKAEMNALNELFDKLEFYTTIFSNANIPHSVQVYTDSKDVQQLLQSPHPKPKESAMIFSILNAKNQLNKIHLGALKDTIEATQSNAPTILKHIPGTTNMADGLTKATSTTPLWKSQHNNQPNLKEKGERER